jgi:hypothetical protein
MKTQIRLWHSEHKPSALGPRDFTDTDATLWLASGAPGAMDSCVAEAVVICAVTSREDLIAVAIVPESLESETSLNGAPLHPGIHGIRHADRLEIGDQSVWVASCSMVEVTQYDPAIHGEAVFCFLTKARLTTGQPIVLCPGAAGTTCGVIYKQSAWELAMKSPTRLRCANCGFRPDESDWQPPELKHRSRIDDVLHSVIATTASRSEP